MERNSSVRRTSLVLIGSAILAFGMYHFNYQNDITEGGVLGLLLFFKNMWNIEPGMSNLIIDGVLFLVGMRFFGKAFIYYSLLATLSFSLFYTGFATLGPFVPVLESKLLATILAGVFVGVGVGLVVRAGAASGGDDVLALLAEKYTRLKIGHVYLLTDALVLTLSSLYLGPTDLFWSLVAVLISGRVINWLFYWQPRKALVT